MSEWRYKAFISYSHRDELWATWLHKSLESYRPPKQLVGTQTARGPVPRRLNPVFRDREELASATDLGEHLNAALRDSAGKLPPEEAVGYVLEALVAVAEAHALGIVHRDLKPSNLFLARRRDGSTIVKVLDFGI